jgi:hypothetical protein
MREATLRGLSRETALAALTTAPAHLLGIESRAGTIAPGKDANLLVATRDLFEKGAEIEEVWIDGVRYGEDPKRAREANVAGEWDLAVEGINPAPALRVEFKKSKDSFIGKIAKVHGSTAPIDTSAQKLEDLALVRGELTFTVSDAAWPGHEARFTLRRDGKILRGHAQAAQDALAVLGTKAPGDSVDFSPDLSKDAPIWPPVASTEKSGTALVKNATIWTCGPQGILENADLLVQGGKIAAVGRGLSAPRGAVVVEGEGRHITPGIIDCHSHSDIAGDVNEGTNSCTAEVRISDVIDPESPALYRELAAGVTAANLLHGSANTIGGQNSVIK